MGHCPELAAGLPVPRLPAEIIGGEGDKVMRDRAKIVESDGRDVTAHYQLDAARAAGCEAALLIDGSPTCGSQTIYNGRFQGEKIPGSGVAAALLRQYGIRVFSSEQIDELILWVNDKEKVNDPV